jgi:RNA polymerase sigma-70 factor (ECF subfamily)
MDERDLFERHAAAVLQFFVNKVREPSDANDLAQETFVRCFQRLRRGDVEHPRAFLFGVASFVLREYWTANARHQRRAPPDAPEGFDPGSLSVVEMGAAATSITSIMAREQGQRRMLDAMRRLRLDHQNVLELRYWHDLKYSEIAEILGESEQTVGIWIRRAKEHLRRLLERPDAPAPEPAAPFTPRALDLWLRSASHALDGGAHTSAASMKT